MTCPTKALDTVEQISVYTRELQQSGAMKDMWLQLHNRDEGNQ